MRQKYIFILVVLFMSACTLDNLHEEFEISNCDIFVDFSFSPTNSCQAPCEVMFVSDAPDALTYQWDFGDGTTSSQENPNHVFSNPGEYKVKLTVSDGTCEKDDESTITISTKKFETIIEQGASSDGLVINDVALANDGGYVIVGRRGVEFVGSYGFWYKTDLNGQLIDEKRFGCCFQINSESSDAIAVKAVPGIGYIVSGAIEPPGSSNSFPFASLLDENGEELWFFIDDNIGYANNIITTLDGGYILAGSRGVYPDDVGYLAKINSAGVKVWEKGLLNAELIESIYQNQDGTFYANGFSFVDPPHVFKIAANGSVLQTTTIEPIYSSTPARFTLASDNGYIYVAESLTSNSTNSTIYKFNNNGNLEWSTPVSEVNVQEAILLEDGDFLICGTTATFDFSQNPDCYYAKMNASGEILWEKEVGGQETDTGGACVQTADGGYFISGTETSMSSIDTQPGNIGIYLLKTDSDGNIE